MAHGASELAHVVPPRRAPARCRLGFYFDTFIYGNGTIDKEELRTHLKTFTKYSYKAISNIYKLLDVNEDGEIERSELRDAFVKYSALRQAIGEGPNFK